MQSAGRQFPDRLVQSNLKILNVRMVMVLLSITPAMVLSWSADTFINLKFRKNNPVQRSNKIL